jgi:hypothetical protein
MIAPKKPRPSQLLFSGSKKNLSIMNLGRLFSNSIRRKQVSEGEIEKKGGVTCPPTINIFVRAYL